MVLGGCPDDTRDGPDDIERPLWLRAKFSSAPMCFNCSASLRDRDHYAHSCNPRKLCMYVLTLYVYVYLLFPPG